MLAALRELGERVTEPGHVAAVALASWAGGLEIDEDDVLRAIAATEAWLEDDVPHLRAALYGTGPLGTLARSDAVEGCCHLARS